jgi:ethanolamine utilization microcompartment shell protein EutL
MHTEVAAALRSANVLVELLSTPKSLSNYEELTAAVLEVNSRLMNATTVALASQEVQSNLLSRIRELETELANVAGWEAQAERYALHTLAPERFAYALKPDAANGEPFHLLCANCFTKRQKVLLQLRNHNKFGRSYSCHNCRSEIYVDFP